MCIRDRADITLEILGGTFVIMSPSPNIGGTCPPCPIGIDAPDSNGAYGELHKTKHTFLYVWRIIYVARSSVFGSKHCQK